MSTRFLVFRLYGPMASWGDPAVGEVRPSENRPSRSALLGLLAAALGLRREEEAKHRALDEGVRLGVVVDAVGVPLSDYHTIQFGKPKRGRHFATRREQLGGPSHELSTLLSERHYRCDAEYRVAGWITNPTCPWGLDDLRRALERPCFVLYLGRKSCPLALPTAPRIVEAASLAEAFAAFPLRVAEHPPTPAVHPALAGKRKGLYWEEDESIGGVPVSSRAARRDEPLSRTRWTFGRRDELRGTLPEGA